MMMMMMMIDVNKFDGDGVSNDVYIGDVDDDNEG